MLIVYLKLKIFFLKLLTSKIPTKTVVLRYCRLYLRTFQASVSQGKGNYCVLTQSPFQSLVLSKSSQIAVDETYNEVIEDGETFYLINMVGYCEELERWVPGPRICLNGKSKNDYIQAFQQVLKILNDDIPGFQAKVWKVVAVDFERALTDALRNAFGCDSSILGMSSALAKKCGKNCN